jgi:uncharacterized protein
MAGQEASALSVRNNHGYMLLVKTKIGTSPINGIGLFADQFIEKGTLVWKYMPGFDLLISKEEIERLSEPAREQTNNYAYFDTGHSKYMLCSDDARFFNHSNTPNCDESQNDITVAMRDINKGEELVVNYRVFYGNLEEHPETL